MAIAVLMPQDCLPTSKSRPKTGFSEAFYHVDSAPDAKNGAFQASLLKNKAPSYQEPLKRLPTGRMEWIAKVAASASLHDLSIQKDNGGRKAKARRPTETRGSMKTGSKGPAFTILARPMSRDAAEEVLAAFLKKTNGQKALHEPDAVDLHNGTPGGPLDLRGDESKVYHSLSKQAAESKMAVYSLKKGGLDSKEGVHSRMVVGASRTISCVQNTNHNIEHIGSVRLRRASTDPQLVKHLVGNHNTEAIDIPWKAKFCDGFASATSISFPERWAGPAYSSSPPPSSLPLPKFSLPNSKLLSCQSSFSVVDQNNDDMLKPPAVPNMVMFQASSKGEAMDVALATKSLRRMLKLDPC